MAHHWSSVVDAWDDTLLWFSLDTKLDFARFVRLEASGIDPEEAFGGDKLEDLIERHDNGAEVTGSSPCPSLPPHYLNLVALAGWAQAGNRVRRL
jgi:hypothetical protein